MNAPNKLVGTRPKLLLLDPYPRNNPYRMTAAERRSIWFPKLSLVYPAALGSPIGR